eukprot:5024337-Amphidinium_carterae.1
MSVNRKTGGDGLQRLEAPTSVNRHCEDRSDYFDKVGRRYQVLSSLTITFKGYKKGARCLIFSFSKCLIFWTPCVSCNQKAGNVQSSLCLQHAWALAFSTDLVLVLPDLHAHASRAKIIQGTYFAGIP